MWLLNRGGFEKRRKEKLRKEFSDSVSCPECDEPIGGKLLSFSVGPWPTDDGYAIIGQADCPYCGEPLCVTSIGTVVKGGPWE